MGRGSCWTKVHDGALCKAWLAASEDSINGTGQKAKSFWSSVFEVRVNLLCNEAPDGENSATDRTQSSVQSRWGTINREVTKFCGIHAQVKSVAKSGWNDDNYYDEAEKLYVAESKAKSKPTKFAFKVCWEVLKVAPKWTVNCGYIHDPKSASKMSEEEGAQKKNEHNHPIDNKAAKIVQKQCRSRKVNNSQSIRVALLQWNVRRAEFNWLQ